jgi:plasmid maintenance system antidote protein VapI
MDARSYWTHYVERNGGPTAVAKALEIPPQTIYAICNGHRGIGQVVASRMAAKDPLLDKNVLIWVQAEKKRA